MRFYEFDLNEDALFEIKMKPGYLAKLASSIDAQAGMEFEMIVPMQDEDPHLEPDYSADQHSVNFEEIREFFLIDDANERRTVDDAISQLADEWQEWAQEKIDRNWRLDGFEFYQTYFRKKLWNIEEHEKEIKQLAFELSEDNGFDMISNESTMKGLINRAWEEYLLVGTAAHSNTAALLKMAEKEIFKKVLESFWKREIDLERVRERFEEEGFENHTLEEFLDLQYPMMSNIEEEFSLIWPYMEAEQNLDLETMSQNFSAGIDKPVNFSDNYHGAHRKSGHYVVEPDSSLNPNDSSSERGLEFVSHVMPIQELLQDLENIFEWANNIGAYTNRSCGLHMNVSIPDRDFNELDYVKLALLLGDEYILNKFSRSTNTYAASSIKQIKKIVQGYGNEFNDEVIINILDKMKSNFDQNAARTIHGLQTNKYSSINIKQENGNQWVEFRSPGGDWLNKSIEELTATLLRFVVALDAALDPTKYRDEYAKKLYKLLDVIGDPDSIKVFVKYSTGEWTRDQIKSALRLKHKVPAPKTATQDNNAEQPQSPNIQQQSSQGYNVTSADNTARMYVMARSEDEAIRLAREIDPTIFSEQPTARLVDY